MTSSVNEATLAVPSEVTTPQRSPRRILTGYAPSACQECGQKYTPIRVDQQFCSKVCKLATTNREQVRGRRLYALAYNWRANRKDSQVELRELCREISEMIHEDRRLGRKPPPRYNPQRRGEVTKV